MEPIKSKHFDGLFMSCGGGLLFQWSVRQRKVIKGYGQVHSDKTYIMRTSADKKYLFVTDYLGYLTQIDLRSQGILYDYGKGRRQIHAIATTFDNKFLFLAWDRDLLQYQLDDHTLAKIYHFDQGIWSVITTYDNKHAFIGLDSGSIHQICIDSHTMIKYYDKVHKF
jgi:hypothetical protein